MKGTNIQSVIFPNVTDKKERDRIFALVEHYGFEVYGPTKEHIDVDIYPSLRFKLHSNLLIATKGTVHNFDKCIEICIGKLEKFLLSVYKYQNFKVGDRIVRSTHSSPIEVKTTGFRFTISGHCYVWWENQENGDRGTWDIDYVVKIDKDSSNSNNLKTNKNEVQNEVKTNSKGLGGCSIRSRRETIRVSSSERLVGNPVKVNTRRKKVGRLKISSTIISTRHS